MDSIQFLLKFLIGSTAFCMLAIWLKELIQLGTGMLLAPKFGFKVNRFSIFHLMFDKVDGVWIRSVGKRSPLIQSYMTVDLSIPREPDEVQKKEKQLEAVRILILLAVSGGILALCWNPVMRIKAGTDSILDWLPAGFAVGMCWHSLITMGIRFYVYGIMMKKLMGYVQTLTNRLRAGERFSDMMLRPVEELPYKNPSQMEKNFYYAYYLSAMLEQGNIGALQKPTREMTAFFRDREYIMQETWSYYWLVFYYSRFELNPAAATHFLNKIRPTIEQDHDANAKRVLAYYAFGIEQDFQKSRALLTDAYSVLNKFSSYGERELERKLLDDLDGFLRSNRA